MFRPRALPSYLQVLHHPLQIIALSPRRLTADSELWLDVKSSPVSGVTFILVWAGGFTDKKPQSNVFETKGYVHANTWVRGVKSTTQTSMPTRAYARVALFRPDTNARSMLVNSRTHLHYPSQKQWLPGMRGKQEPPHRARSGAPTCSHETLVGCSPTHTNQPTGRQLPPDPTRVLTEGESPYVLCCQYFLSGSESQDADEEEEEQTP